MKTVADKFAAEELFIYTINNSAVYHCSIKPLIANYRRKIAKNQYDKEKAIKGFENIAKIGAMHYEKDFLNTKYYIVFNAATRRVAAERILEFFEDEIMEVDKMIAYYSGFYGIEIQTIEYGVEDKVVFTAGAWTGNKSNHRCKVYYETGRPYFKFKGQRIHLDECIRG